jgi:hypothetical protein
MDPTPSPLRRITRSMASPLGGVSPMTGGFTEAIEAGIAAAAAAAGGDGRSRRSTMNRFADQQNKWGFVPGEDDTMQMDLDMPGRWYLICCAYMPQQASMHGMYVWCCNVQSSGHAMLIAHNAAAAAAAAAVYAALQARVAWVRPRCTMCTLRAQAPGSSH